MNAINIIFDGPPGPESGRFIEVETDEGKGVNVGEWIERKDGLWALRIEMPQSECNCIMCRQLDAIMDNPSRPTEEKDLKWTPVSYTGQRKCDNCDREYKVSDHYIQLELAKSKDRPLCPACTWWKVTYNPDTETLIAKSNDGTNLTMQTTDDGKTWTPVK